MTQKISNIVFLVYILISFYVFGAGMVNSLVGYRSWQWVGASEFVKFHEISTSSIIPVFVIFFFLMIIPLILLFWFRPMIIPKWLIWAALFFYLINLISTIILQIPIQNELNKGYSIELIEKLIWTDMIYRRTTITFLTLTNSVMLYKVISNSNRILPK